MIVLAITLCILVAIGAAIAHLSKSRNGMALMNDDAAFEGVIDYYRVSQERIDELRPFIDSVGIISRGLREKNNRYERRDVVESFDIFVIDTNGAIHDVLTLEDRSEAARIARHIARVFEAPLDDPAGILMGN